MKSGTTNENPCTGQRFVLTASPDETAGRSFAGEWTIAPRRGRDGVPAHLHPHASERFTVIAGRARYQLAGVEGDLGPGEAVDMPAGVPHIHPWSVSDEELRYTQQAFADPPDAESLRRSLAALATLFAPAREGKVNSQGVP